MKFKPVHPFPARMAPSIALDELPHAADRPLVVLDPMMGSGTTLLAARTRGHHALGFDTDPLALLISEVWCADSTRTTVLRHADSVYQRASNCYRKITQRTAYPDGADDETKQFVRYWFDPTNRRQLCALSEAIDAVRHSTTRKVLWCAFSRLIIAKSRGASMAIDLSHSRPHKVSDKEPHRPLPNFLKAVKVVLDNSPFCDRKSDEPPASVRDGDARCLPIGDSSVDIVITSPPYLNAIDYLRCNKFSLVWMGHRIPDLRKLRAGNIGTEVGAYSDEALIQRAVVAACAMGNLRDADTRMLTRYAQDMNAVVREVGRVLRVGGRCVLVIGNCSNRGTFIRNSEVITTLARPHGLRVHSVVGRELPPNRRYLPPPTNGQSGALQGRMREEIVLTLVKRASPKRGAL